MPKTKHSPTSLVPSLEELVSKYPRTDLIRALAVLQNDLGWQIFRAALMKEYLNTVAYALDKASKTGTQIEAAYFSGCAQTMFDTANSVIDKYIAVLAEKSAAVENDRPEEV